MAESFRLLNSESWLLGKAMRFKVNQSAEIELVRFVLWDAVALKAYERAVRELLTR